MEDISDREGFDDGEDVFDGKDDLDDVEIGDDDGEIGDDDGENENSSNLHLQNVYCDYRRDSGKSQPSQVKMPK